MITPEFDCAQHPQLENLQKPTNVNEIGISLSENVHTSSDAPNSAEEYAKAYAPRRRPQTVEEIADALKDAERRLGKANKLAQPTLIKASETEVRFWKTMLARKVGAR